MGFKIKNSLPKTETPKTKQDFDRTCQILQPHQDIKPNRTLKAGSSGGAGGSGRPTTIHGWLKSFSKLKPLSFSSAASPQEAEDWITHMEKNFEVLGSGDEFKARLATFKLEGDALNWWKAHKQAKGGDVYMTTCTWAEFCGTFYKRYFPDSEHQRFKREYNTIRQREDLNSGEYMQRFLRLASFVGPNAGDASRQAKHFKWGLKKWVLDRLLYTEVIISLALRPGNMLAIAAATIASNLGISISSSGFPLGCPLRTVLTI
ncbi:zinc finger, CCHC-type, Retrotransposon gag domain protein [Artemisia annua]|uniref:Zinc finger, CCHC-type, Retrotransposon gag domain protein n=1 Tax=Artemisia annua TaxID=35608 RepID=A0A2U1KKU6_ARTAN|nr:zinc finger, CCHC-type, Retrotransposon gag domain protein [Artemisia annua]